MRWKTQKETPIRPGDERRVTRFAFIPTDIDGTTIWFERFIKTEKFKPAMYSWQLEKVELYERASNSNLGEAGQWQEHSSPKPEEGDGRILFGLLPKICRALV